MPAKKYLILSRRFPDAVMERAARDYRLAVNEDDRQLSPDELLGRLGTADAALVSITDRIDAEFIRALPPQVGVIATFSVGTDHIDLSAARARGLKVGNAPHGVTVATAEIAMLLILGAARRAPEGASELLGGRWTGWTPTQLLGRRLDGKILGIYGMGKIGSALAKRARAFDMQIHYHSRRPVTDEDQRGAIYHHSAQSLFATADILSLNAPSTPETRSIIRDETIGWLKPGAILVNTARGDLVDDGALIAALKDGRIGYAGLDVYKGEPALDRGYIALPNAFLLPHLGSATIESRNQMGFEALDNIDAYFAGKPLPFAVA